MSRRGVCVRIALHAYERIFAESSCDARDVSIDDILIVRRFAYYSSHSTGRVGGQDETREFIVIDQREWLRLRRLFFCRSSIAFALPCLSHCISYLFSSAVFAEA